MLRKLISLIFLNIVIVTSGLNGMDGKRQQGYFQKALACFKSAPEVITESYEPSINTRINIRYPWVSALSKSLVVGASVGMATYYGRNLFNSKFLTKFNPAYIGIGGFLISCLYQRNKAPKLIDALLINPLAALQQAYSVRDKVESEGNYYKLDELDIDLGMKKYKGIVGKFEKECPLFLLGECTEEDWGPCLLSRTYEPRYRNCFEQTVVESFVEKINNSDNSIVHYASFACGGTFQDLVILTKVLAQKPDASLIVHLIDLNYSPYIVSTDFMGHGREITSENEINLNPIMGALVSDIRAKKWGGVDETKDDATIEKSLKVDCSHLEQKVKQIISWLQKTFPNANLSFFVHDTANSYLTYLDKNNLSYPDIITAVDIQDEMSLLRRSNIDYINLCIETLQNKENSCNFWLAKFGGRAQIKNLSLKEIPDSESIIFKEGKDASDEDSNEEEISDDEEEVSDEDEKKEDEGGIKIYVKSTVL